VLKRIFGPKKDEVTGEWRRLHNEEIYDMNSSLNITRVIKSRTRRARRTFGGEESCIEVFGGET
jgi:hypothetical protein